MHIFIIKYIVFSTHLLQTQRMLCLNSLTIIYDITYDLTYIIINDITYGITYDII